MTLLKLLSGSLLVSVKLQRPASFRKFSTTIMAFDKRGLVLGVFSEKETDKGLKFTPNAESYDKSTSGQLLKLFQLSVEGALKKAKCRVFYGLDNVYSGVAVVSLGSADAGFNENEELDEKRENIRLAVAAGIRHLREIGINHIDVDHCGDAEAAGEAAGLTRFSYDELKQASSKKPPCVLNLYPSEAQAGEKNGWERGLILAEGQNLARRLMETPANLMTPTIFASVASEILGPKGVRVTARDREWATGMKMGSFLSVARGSDEPPVFLEVAYNGAPDSEKPLVLVGKGITFDSGGISLKPSLDMDKMRADMGGASCVIATISTIASLKLPINVVGLTPLSENLPSGHATKPGDVVFAMNGKSIQVDNTDAEGRLVLADALCYAHTFEPKAIVDLATLTGAMMIALGSSATGVFTNSPIIWDLMHASGSLTGDRVWRMPLFDHYSRYMTECQLADLNNIGSSRHGGACTAAAFLREFVTAKHWAHLDIAGVMEYKDDVNYLCKGMSGRPTRTLVEFIRRVSEQKPF